LEREDFNRAATMKWGGRWWWI